MAWGLLVVVVALGGALRCTRLGAKSLTLDEATTLHVVERPVGEVLVTPRRWDPHPPLYYAALRLWLRRAEGVASARAFSAAAGLATLVALYALARLVVPRWAALLAAALLAVSSLHVCVSQQARLYALAAFLVTASWYFLAELVAGRRLERWPMWCGLALTNTAALYTCSHSVFAVGAQLLALLLVWRAVASRR